MAILFNALGLLGVGCITLAYFLTQSGKLTSSAPAYLWLNLAGAILITLSVFWDWNLSAFVIEVIWAGISIYGLFKHYRRKKA